MSSFGTHMLIGAVGGMALARLLPPAVLPMSPVMAALVLIGGSAVLATWPDIDEPRSWIGQRVQLVVTLIGVVLGALVGATSAARLPMEPLTAMTIGGVLGTIIGSVSGILLLKGIRLAAGGHRRATHSLLLGGLLLGVGAALWLLGAAPMKPWALIPTALAWGQMLHLLGDIVTPAGVPVFYPLSTRDLRVLPAPLCRFGEGIAALTAGVSALLLLGVIHF